MFFQCKYVFNIVININILSVGGQVLDAAILAMVSVS